jgi:hypothetical protein
LLNFFVIKLFLLKFSSNLEFSTVTDDDIDQILRKSEEKTAELSTKYQSLGLEDLQNFTSESAYQWQGEDWSNRVSLI